MPQNEKLNKLKQLIELIDERVTRKEITAIVKQMKEFLVTLKGKNQTEFKNLNQSVTDLSEKLKGDNSQNITTLKAEFSKVITKALKDQEDGMNFIKDKVRGIKSGLDGKDGKSGVDGVSGKDGKDGSQDTPVQIAEKLEILKDDNRLKIEAIKDLKEKLDKLEKRPTGGGARKVIYTKRINLTDQCNGTLKEFLLPKDTINVLGVWGTQFPITFDEADFTFTGRTLTLTSEVEAPATGQTLFALIQTNFYGKI